jgi:hypothetical protein
MAHELHSKDGGHACKMLAHMLDCSYTVNGCLACTPANIWQNCCNVRTSMPGVARAAAFSAAVL